MIEPSLSVCLSLTIYLRFVMTYLSFKCCINEVFLSVSWGLANRLTMKLKTQLSGECLWKTNHLERCKNVCSTALMYLCMTSASAARRLQTMDHNSCVSAAQGQSEDLWCFHLFVPLNFINPSFLRSRTSSSPHLRAQRHSLDSNMFSC